MKKGFTLVELIVVITIVGILSTIGFVSYSGYLTGARDSNRISQLVKLSDSFQVYSATKSLPLPDNAVTLTASGTTNIVGYQGTAGVDVLETIEYTNGGKDPKDDSYFTYYVTKNRKYMQLLAFMEENQLQAGVQKTYAVDYAKRYIKTYGKKLGALVQSTTNIPLQELGISQLDLVNTTGSYIAYISDNEKIQGTGSVLQTSLPNASCKRLRQIGGMYDNSFYDLFIDGETVAAFCHTDFIEQSFYTFVDNGGFEKSRPKAWYTPYLSSSANFSGVSGLQFTGYLSFGSFDEYIYVDPKKAYNLSGYARSQGVGGSILYYGFSEYDEKFRIILGEEVNISPATETYLTNSISASDTSLTFADTNGTMCSFWQSRTGFATTGLVAFDIDDTGTYTDLPNRNLSIPYTLPGGVGVGFSSITDNGTTCTLQNIGGPFGKTYPAGTKIRMHHRGLTLNYIGASGITVPASWTYYSGTITGQQLFGINNNKFRPGARFIKLVVIPNYRQDNTKILQLDDLRLTIQ